MLFTIWAAIQYIRPLFQIKTISFSKKIKIKTFVKILIVKCFIIKSNLGLSREKMVFKFSKKWSYFISNKVVQFFRVRCWQVQCREPKTGNQRFNFITKTIPLCPSSYIIYLWRKLSYTVCD